MRRSQVKRLINFFLLYTLSSWSYCTFKIILMLTSPEKPKTKKQKTDPCLVAFPFFHPKDHTIWTWRCTGAAPNIAPTKGGAQNQFDFQIWSYDGCQGQFSLRGLLSVITQTRLARILKGKPTEHRRFLRLRSVCLLQSLLTVHHLLWISYKFWKKNKKRGGKKVGLNTIEDICLKLGEERSQTNCLNTNYLLRFKIKVDIWWRSPEI